MRNPRGSDSLLLVLASLTWGTLARAQAPDGAEGTTVAPAPVLEAPAAPPRAPAPSDDAPAPAPLTGPGPGELLPGATLPAAATDAHEAADSKEEAIFNASKQRIDATLDDLLEVPETPAAFTLGLSPDVVARPSSLKEVAGALKTIIGADGKLVPGAAIEVAPFYRLVTRDATAEDWVKDVYRPLLGGFRLSLATASDPRASDSGNAPTLVALGARLGIDTTDIRYHANAVTELRRTLASCAPAQTLPGGAEGQVTHLELQPNCEFEKREKSLTSELSGIRAELAGTATFVDRREGDAQAELRAWRGWVAVEGRTSANFGAGLAADYELVRQPGPDLHNVRGGARLNLDTTVVDASLGAAYVRRSRAEDGDNWLELGGSASAKLSSLGLLTVGVQLSRSLEDDRRDLIALVALSTASGEPLVSKYFDMKPKPPPQ